MKAHRAGLIMLASLALCFVHLAVARAEVRSLRVAQTLTPPPAPAFTLFGQNIAIDGNHLIVLAMYDGGQQALLYRRNARDGQWVYRRVLLNWTGPFVQAHVAMRNGIAVLQFGRYVTILEWSGSDYVRGNSVAPIRHHGGVAISGDRVLIGGDNCDYDAVIYQKNGAGSWDVTGRIDDNQGQCFAPFESYAMELHYTYAILRAPDEAAGRAWRRNGSAIDWIPAGVLAEQTGAAGAFALQGLTAIAPNGGIWRRSGMDTWTRQGELLSVDRDNGSGATFNVVYRDGVLVTNESGRFQPFPRVFVEPSAGQFVHVASMPFFDATIPGDLDVSHRTVVVTARNYYTSQQYVRTFDLPMPLPAPGPVVNDFEDRQISEFVFSGGQFALATRGSDEVLAQNASNGFARAVIDDTDWTDHQRVEADITPTFGGPSSWVGLVARYVDPDNYYYLGVRGNETYGIYKRVDGVDVLLHQGVFYNARPPTFRAMLRVSGDQIDVDFGFQQGATVTDRTHPRGRAGLATWNVRADFDDVQVAATDEYDLFGREYGFAGADYESGLEELSGTWEVGEYSDGEESHLTGLSQSDTRGDAVAVIGTAVPNQDVNAILRLDSFAPSGQGAWFGLLARYVDAHNHYYVTARSTGQIQIRKIVNGVITVLASADFTAVPNQYYALRLLVINDQLQLYVDRRLVASAHDHDIASGRYGIATYRAAATWDAFWVVQP